MPKKIVKESDDGELFMIGEEIIIGAPDVYFKRVEDDEILFSDHKSNKYVVNGIKLLEDSRTRYTFKQVKE